MHIFCASTPPQECRTRGASGVMAPKILVEQLTLSQPCQGQHIMLNRLLLAPPPSGFLDLPTASMRYGRRLLLHVFYTVILNNC